MSNSTKTKAKESQPKSSFVKNSWSLRGILNLNDSPGDTSLTTKEKKSLPPNVLDSSENTSANPVYTANSPDSKNVNKCFCCGTILTFPNKAKKYKCSICHTTNIIELAQLKHDSSQNTFVSLNEVNRLVENCFTDTTLESNQSKTLHDIFSPLSSYLYNAFRSQNILNNSFKFRHSSRKLHHHSSNINYMEIYEVFNLLTKLPTKRPLFSALKGASENLKRIHILCDEVAHYNWIFILLHIPFLSSSLVGGTSHDSKKNLMKDEPEIKVLCYDILKRCLGIISCIANDLVLNYWSSWMSNYDSFHFMQRLDVINLYITFQLKKYFYLANNPHIKLSNSPSSTSPGNLEIDLNCEDQEYFQNVNLKEHISSSSSFSLAEPLTFPRNQISTDPFPLKSKKSTNQATKIKIHQYGNDWRIQSALKVLTLFVRANKLRGRKQLPASAFYNSLVDYVNIRLDFDSWQSNKSVQNYNSSSQAELKSIIGYIHGTSKNKSLFNDALFYICQYPFLISLGSKISVLEYEAKRQMERKAEEAFINSLDKRVVIDVYFRIKIRRDHIVQDSLQAIRSNMENLKKSLRVQFVNEPGVDAGGLRKEWFILLVKEIFNPQTGMFHNVDDSNMLWFNAISIDNHEMYHLFGAVLGLAIYNSTILELQFPIALYKILLGKSLSKADYGHLYPQTYDNLLKLKKLSDEEIQDLNMTFEITFTDIFGTYYTKELIPNGSKTLLTKCNLDEYLDKYMMFCIRDGIKSQVDSFTKGFNNVVGGNALSLFSPEEIQLLLCGSNDHTIDVETLKSITKYIGWNSRSDASNSKIISWFWEYMAEADNVKRKKILTFVTGSDRVPATGLQNLPFRISLLGNGNDSNRLPLAHTCFNELALYNYVNKQKLETKMNLAVEESSGFGIK
ncbi:HUL4 [Candida pseudojiufengensis]|uniref:HUL4 n=1 Tax=Candida pseudojiufengensis TaxID=497109 RepID=UPI002223FBB5|nr:HUL4 [Candida pseudojiufengensis]KAI5966896.1 HUL4 [Candida pseudojiufengensis]